MALKRDNNQIVLRLIFPAYAEVGSVNVITILDLLIYICVFIVSGRQGKRLQYALKKFSFVWLFFIIWCVQACVDTDIYTGFMYFYNNILFCIVIYIFACGVKRISDYIYPLVYVSFILSVLGLFEEITRVNIFSVIFNGEIYSEVREGISRICGPFAHPIVYGIFLVFCLGILIYIMKTDKRIRFKIFFLLCAVNLILTVSRSIIAIGIIACFIIMYQCGYFESFTKNFVRIIGLILLVAFVVYFFPDISSVVQSLSESVINVFKNWGDSSGNSAAGNRFQLYAWVYETVRGHLLFGMGTSASFSYVVSRNTWGNIVKESLENQYLGVLFNHGIVGLVTFCLALINIICFFIKFIKKHDCEATLFIKVIFMLTVAYILQFFAVAQGSETYTWYYLVFLALGFCFSTDKEMIVKNEIS